MSHATPSSSIFLASCMGTERARRRIKSLALRIAAGSQVFLVVLTDMEPSIKSSVHAMPTSLSSFVTKGHAAGERISTSETIDQD